MAVSRRDDDGLTGWALILGIVIAVLILILNRDQAQRRLSSPVAADELTSPALEIMSRPISAVESYMFNARDRRRAHEENKVLRSELLSLREAQARADVLRYKVERYEKLLGTDVETEIPLTKIAARAVSETNSPFVQSLLINVGLKDGVKVGNPVMSPDGMIGHIIRVGNNSSRVLKLTDLNSRIAVKSTNSESRAILSGDNSDLPKLSYMNDRKSWQVGTAIITSGDEGMLPQGLPIGSIVASDEADLRVKLGSEGKAIDWVWVSPFVILAAPEEDESSEAETTAPIEGESRVVVEEAN